MNRQPSLHCGVEMTDRGPPLVLGRRGQIAQIRHYLHVDNIGNVSDHVTQVHMALNESRQDFEKSRLMLHEISISSGSHRALGFELDVEQLRTLARSGCIREGLMGHVTLLGFLFQCVHCFARKNLPPTGNIGSVHVPSSKAFIGVMILIEADRIRPRFPCVLASDASLSGFGVAQSFWSISDVSAVGRIPEVRRWRCGAVPARRHAFQSAGFRVDSRSGEVLRDGFGRPFSLDLEMVEILASERWDTDPSFPEVPSQLLSSDSWKKVMADTWFFDDDILRLVNRALVKAAERAAHSQPVHDCRLLLVTIFQQCSASTGDDRATSDS